MRIAMIGHKRIPGGEGGVEVVVEQLAVRMVAEGHAVTVYNRAAKHAPRLKEYQGVRIITVPTINSKRLDAIVYALLATLHALFCRYDVIHYHAEGPCALLWLPHLFGKRTVATIHGLDWQRAKWGGFATRFLRFGERTAARCADAVTVLSENVQQYFLAVYKRSTVLVPNGIPPCTRRAPDIIAQKYGLAEGNYVLFLARIVPEKGLTYLLDAFANLDTPLKLVVAGGSSHTDDYYTAVCEKAGRDPRVILTGFVRGAEKDELYTNCRLYVLPSDIEGMPISLLEAVGYGCPCLVSDIPENTQVSPQLRTFAHGDTAALEAALRSALAEKLTAPTAGEAYSWQRAVEQYLALYAQA